MHVGIVVKEEATTEFLFINRKVMDKRNTILLAMGSAGHEATMDVIRRYLVYNTKGRHGHLQSMIADDTIERSDVADGTYLTQDGRPVFWYANEAWVTKPEVHNRRLAEAMEQASQRDAAISDQQSQIEYPAMSTTVCTTLIDGQLCGGDLVKRSVCQNCALGKSGVIATLTCDICGHVTAIMRETKNG